MPHRARRAEVLIDGDAGDPRAEPAVGAEVAVVDVAHAEVAAAVGARDGDGPPHDGVQVPRVVAALDGGDAAVSRGLLLVGRQREVPAVGGAVEEHVVDAVAQDPVHPPHRVQRRLAAEREQGDPNPVLVGVEVRRAAHAAPQPHVDPVGEFVHRGRVPRWWWWLGGEERRLAWSRGGAASMGRGRGGGSRAEQVFVARRLRLGARAGHFKATAKSVAPLVPSSTDKWGHRRSQVRGRAAGSAW